MEPTAPLAAGWPDQAWRLGVAAGALVVVLCAHAALFFVLCRLARRGGHAETARLVRRLQAPTALATLLVALLALQGALAAPPLTAEALRRVLVAALVGALTWTAVRAIDAGAEALLGHLAPGGLEDVRARRRATQVRLMSRTLAVVVGVLGAAAALMVFPAVRQVGATLLASAGIAGLVTGLAARPALTNLLAGLQIAITDPVRQGDLVVVEGERGTVEEITATYVVILTWDQRHLIVPLGYFLERSFQNWSRRDPALLGAVLLRVDHSAPVEALRAELTRVVEASPRWDRRVCRLQVTDAGERTIELRALVSAADPGALFDLRCEVREALLAWLDRERPAALPRLRVSGEDDAQGA